MSWENVHYKHLERYESNFIVFKEPLERKFLIRIIAEEFPDLSRMRIAAIVDQCVRVLPSPILRVSFLSMVQGYL